MTTARTQGQEGPFDEQAAIEQLLNALEFSTRKREPLIDELLQRYGVRRPRLTAALADRLMRQPGFESFFLDVATATRPFSLMLLDVYRFLSRWRTTTHRKSSDVLVRFAEAQAAFEFDLDAFPVEFLTTVSQQVDPLRLMDLNLESDAWRSLDLLWDFDFYGHGFGRAVSYAPAVLAEADPALRTELEATIDPIIDRLAAITSFVSAHAAQGLEPTDVEWRMDADTTTTFSVGVVDARAHGVRAIGRAGNDPNPWLLHGWDVAGTIWRQKISRIGDRGGWLKEQLGETLPEVSARAFGALLADLAVDFEAKLDEVAPVVESRLRVTDVEQVIKFLSLPFWKHRWYLYELWTLATVLEIAGQEADVDLTELEETQNGQLVWKLPGGDARRPVATIGPEESRLECWSQRKTLHPKTGKGLEPDIRIARAAPSFHDVLIVENKDRITLRKSTVAEIIDRYVGGTCAASTWLINYESFAIADKTLEERWPGRRVRLVERFRPGSVPDSFADDIRALVRAECGPQPPILGSESSPAVDPIQDAPATVPLSVTLSWRGPPQDLDLHAWITRDGHVSHLSYNDTGRLDSPPSAVLDHDSTDGNGRETIEFANREFDRLVLAVHNYSDDGQMNDAEAIVKVDIPPATTISLRPPAGEYRWWHVLDLSDAARNVEVRAAGSEQAPGSPQDGRKTQRRRSLLPPP